MSERGVKTLHPAATERLHQYWVHGEGAAKIAWGTPGDFARCVAHLSKYIRGAEGYCNLAHKSALGIYPATHAKAMGKGRAAEEIFMPTAAELAALAERATKDEPYGDVEYADPGYQADGKKRYPVDAEHVMAAWTYINQADSAAKYTPEQLAKVKARIRAAMKQHGHDVADGRAYESGSLPAHMPAGSPAGGQFAPKGGGGKAAPKAPRKKTARPAARPQQHKPLTKKPDSGNLAYDPNTNTGPGYGSKAGDPRVHRLQAELNRLGVTDGSGKGLKDDGKLGPKTTAAVKKAQKRLGLRADGVVTPALLAKLAGTDKLPGRSAGMHDVCVRSYDFEPVETRSGDGRTLEGYAAVFGSPTTIRDLQGDFTETILPGAFKRTLEQRMPLLQWDHGKDPRIGTAPIGDIQDLREDGHGLYVRARLYDHPDVERVRLAIAGRSVKGMSFRFSVPDGGDDWPAKDERHVRDADVFEVGPVAFPAYDTTTVSVRSMLAQLDPTERQALVRELAADVRLAVDLQNLTGASHAWSEDRGETPGAEPGNGNRPQPHLRQRLDDGALRARGILT